MPLQSQISRTDALDVVRSRLLHLWCAEDFCGGILPAPLREAVDTLDRSVDAILTRSEGFLEPSGPESLVTMGKSDFLLHAVTLSTAWRCRHSRHFHNSEALAGLESALRWFEPLIRPGAVRQGRWYIWDIEIPRALAQILILARDGMPADLGDALADGLLSLPSQVFVIDRDRGVVKPANHGGANAVEVLTGILLRSVALGDAAWADSATPGLALAMRGGDDGQGVQKDGSYHFHGRGVNLAYGFSALASQSLWIYLAKDTPWQCPRTEIDAQLIVLKDFFCLNLWRGRVSPYAVDRSIAIPGVIHGGKSFDRVARLLMLEMLSDISEADRSLLATALADRLPWPGGPSHRATLTDAVLRLKTESVSLPSPSAKPCMRYFPQSEYLVVREPRWFCAVRMCSIRTKSWNSQNGQHVRGSSSAEFSLALMTDGREFDDTLIPTMDWSRLAGVTRCDGVEPPAESYGQSTFVGGVADGTVAGLGMQYLLAPAGQPTLRGNKSLFVTRDAIVLLGSRIRCDATDPVWTTLFQAPLLEGETIFVNGCPFEGHPGGHCLLKSGDIIHARNTTIQLLGEAGLYVVQRSGCYNDMSHPHIAEDGFAAQKFTATWIYVISEHGVRPDNASYGAVLWPATEQGFAPHGPSKFQVVHKPDHHALVLKDGDHGAEVRFPGDYRSIGGLSYFGAEPFKWGSISLWSPAEEDGVYEIQLHVPLRSLQDPENSATEVFLPDGFEAIESPLLTLEGKPFPGNLVPTMANDKTKTLSARRVQ